MPLELSPTHLFNNSGPLTKIKLASLSFATAFANKVFPVPGGPYNNKPFGGFIPNLLNDSICFNGHSTASFNSCFVASNPPISSQFTFGVSINTSLSALGLTNFNASLKSKSVTVNFCKTSSGISSFSPSFISGKILLKTLIAASLHNAETSAPTKPCMISASLIKLTSFASGIFLV